MCVFTQTWYTYTVMYICAIQTESQLDRRVLARFASLCVYKSISAHKLVVYSWYRIDHQSKHTCVVVYAYQSKHMCVVVYAYQSKHACVVVHAYQSKHTCVVVYAYQSKHTCVVAYVCTSGSDDSLSSRSVVHCLLSWSNHFSSSCAVSRALRDCCTPMSACYISTSVAAMHACECLENTYVCMDVYMCMIHM
jgi:hypothetical protein